MTEMASSKAFLSPVSMGRTPAEQLQQLAKAPHERLWPGGGGRGGERLHREQSQLSSSAECQKAQEELRRGAGDISKYLTDFSHILKKTLRPYSFLFFPPTTDPSHFPIRPLLTGPCHCSGPGGSKRALQQPLSVR